MKLRKLQGKIWGNRWHREIDGEVIIHSRELCKKCTLSQVEADKQSPENLQQPHTHPVGVLWSAEKLCFLSFKPDIHL